MRQPHRDSAVLRNGDDTVVLHRYAGQTLADHRDLGDRVGTLTRITALLAEVGGEADVRVGVREEQRGIGLQAVGGVHDGRQRIDVGEHSLGGVVGLGLRFRDDGGDHVADEPHRSLAKIGRLNVGGNIANPCMAGSPGRRRRGYTATTPGIDGQR